MQTIIIDFEFTGLDNTYIRDNEIIQVKAHNVTTGESICRNFGSKKEITAHPFLHHKVKKYDNVLFSGTEFENTINQISEEDIEFKFFGWGVDLDKKMLSKYGIDLSIIDIREKLQLTDFEYALAVEGKSLEVAYYTVIGEIPDLKNHDGIEEIKLIVELFKASLALPQREYLSVMPNGHCAGMPLVQYVSEYRRAADGYRFNNNDLLAKSMNNILDVVNDDWDWDLDDDNE